MCVAKNVSGVGTRGDRREGGTGVPCAAAGSRGGPKKCGGNQLVYGCEGLGDVECLIECAIDVESALKASLGEAAACGVCWRRQQRL